jgi:membrane protein DedA with SNARE-associated domain
MQISYLGIIMLMILSPLPPEVFMPLAGFMVAQGELNFIATIFSGVAGFLLSVLPWYLVGKYLGKKGLNKLLQQNRWLMFSPEKLEKANRWFQQRGGQAMFLSLLLPGTRNIISIPAGISGMRLSTFLTYSAIGATCWLTILTAAGYLLGGRYHLIDRYLGPAYNLVAVILLVAVIIWATRRYLRQTTKRTFKRHERRC